MNSAIPLIYGTCARQPGDIVSFLEGVTLTRFKREKVLRYAVERQLMVIGEAAAHVSGTYRDKHPEIPWMQIIGQRNVLAHEYGEIVVERVWLTATRSVPDLLKTLEKVVPDS